MSKPPTPQAISALLRKAGFNRSRRLQSGGTMSRSTGYVVLKSYADDGRVIVRHNRWSLLPNDAADDAALARYREAITAAGYEVECVRRDLIVTAKENGDA